MTILAGLKPKKLLLVALFLAAMAPGVYFYSQYRAVQNELLNPTASVREEARGVVAAVGKLIELPADEEPTVATVADKDKLKDQPFFANAQNGDRVIIFTKAKKAILYRPATGKIIEVAPISLGTAEPASQVASASGATNLQEPKFILWNGSSVVGLTKKYEIELKNKVQGALVVDRDNARKRDYAKTILIDITGQRADQATGLASTLGLTLVRLPLGEAVPASPAADFLIIVGEDKK